MFIFYIDLFQIIFILEYVKNFLNRMVSFDYYDVFFLLNRWDIFLDDDDEEVFFQRIKMYISSIWREVKFECILKFFMNEVCKCSLFVMWWIFILNLFV